MQGGFAYRAPPQPGCQDLGLIIPPTPGHLLKVLSAPGFCIQKEPGGTSQPASTFMVSVTNLILSSTELNLGYPPSPKTASC